MTITEKLKNEIIISVQAMPKEPLYKEECMKAMMQSVVNGGAKALRLAGARDIKNAKKMFDIPVIGLTKPEQLPKNWIECVYITPSIKEVKQLIKAGADQMEKGNLKPFFSIYDIIIPKSKLDEIWK